MATTQEAQRMMELAGFTEEERRLGLPYLEAVDDPESVLDVLMAFGMPVYAIGRTVGVLKDLQTATGKPRGVIAQALLEVGPYAAQLGLDIESVATSIRVLFQAGSDRPGIAFRKAILDGHRRGSRSYSERAGEAIHLFGEPSPATWEATVLPALRRAMEQHAELRGAAITLEDVHELHAFEVKLSGKGWDCTGGICRGPLVCDIEKDCAALASQAATEATKALAEAEAAGDVDLRQGLY